MNKKLYVAPEMEEMKLTSYVSLLAGSGVTGNDPTIVPGPEPEPDPDDIF